MSPRSNTPTSDSGVPAVNDWSIDIAFGITDEEFNSIGSEEDPEYPDEELLSSYVSLPSFVQEANRTLLIPSVRHCVISFVCYSNSYIEIDNVAFSQVFNKPVNKHVAYLCKHCSLLLPPNIYFFSSLQNEHTVIAATDFINQLTESLLYCDNCREPVHKVYKAEDCIHCTTILNDYFYSYTDYYQYTVDPQYTN